MADDYAYLNSVSAHPGRAGDTSYLNPSFATPLANAIRQANAEGLHIGLESGFRPPTQTGSAYDAGGNSSHTYGVAGDVSGLDGPNGKVTQRWAQIAEANGLHNPYGIGDRAEFSHWQLPEQPLETNPKLLASLKSAYATGDMNNVWSAFNSGGGGSSGGGGASGSYGSAAPPAPSYTFKLPANAPMGMGNNNPLNIKYYKGAENDYPGLIGPSSNTDQGDPQMKFSSPEAGWSAAYSLLNKKYGSGMTTPNEIIAGKGGWTPGKTQAAANVAKAAGIGPDDDIGFNNPANAQKFMRALVTQEQGGAGSAYPDAMIKNAVYGTTLNNTAGAPTTTAGGPSAPAAPGQPGQPPGGLAGSLPGFTPNSPGAKMTAAGLQTLGGGQGAGGGGGGGSGSQPPQPPPPMQLHAQASGGGMMMGAGGQNMYPRALAQQALGQQGFMTQPSFAAYGGNAMPSPIGAPSPGGGVAPGSAQGIPSMPGTTLNSPSQLQMALMSGSINPYDMYARNAGGLGSS